MSVRVAPRSRLRFGIYTEIDGYEFWDLIHYPEVPEQTDDIQHTVLGPERLDTLARRFYDDPNAKWVIALANDIELEPVAFNPGDIIRIPSPRYVKEVLYKKAKF